MYKADRLLNRFQEMRRNLHGLKSSLKCKYGTANIEIEMFYVFTPPLTFSTTS